jgi:hypothetical protein
VNVATTVYVLLLGSYDDIAADAVYGRLEDAVASDCEST